MAVEDLSHQAAASLSSSSKRYTSEELGFYAALGFCRADFKECNSCNCSENPLGRGTCCCSNCEEFVGQPRQAAQSQSQAAEPTLVLRPGHDLYNTQAAAAFHTVVQPELLATGESPAPAGGLFLRESSVLSPRSYTWTTGDSESGSEAYLFEPVAPVVRTRRPPSVPPLALPGGVAIGGVLKCPTTLSTTSGVSTTHSSSATSSGLQVSGTQCSRRDAKNYPALWKGQAPKLSRPCAPALRKTPECSPRHGGEASERTSRTGQSSEAPAEEDLPARIDAQALERVKDYLASRPDLENLCELEAAAALNARSSQKRSARLGGA